MKEEQDEIRKRVRTAATDAELGQCRRSLAAHSAQVFLRVGDELAVAGNVFGGDRAAGTSPWGNGSDEAVAVSVLLRIGSQLIGGTADLLDRGRHYAAASLVRQLVEVEYLAWAFDSRDRDGERWLRSTKEERKKFFKPEKLRKAAEGHFRNCDYSYHCELGGHPVPGGVVLLGAEAAGAGELVLADALGHSGRIWDHMVGWARRMELHGILVAARVADMNARYQRWKQEDALASLPPAPELG